MFSLCRRLAGALAVAAVIATGFAVGRAQEREDHNSGSYLYRAFCAPCHGFDGKGKGPAADTLTRPVPDLTLLTPTAGGVFPRDNVLKALNGTRPVPSHSGSAMPQWSVVFNTLERDQRAVQKRLSAPVHYVESLQLKDRQ